MICTWRFGAEFCGFLDREAPKIRTVRVDLIDASSSGSCRRENLEELTSVETETAKIIGSAKSGIF